MIVPPWQPHTSRYLYEQLADHLAARIMAGEFPAGSRLPPERDLAASYGVAFHTVRSATALLRERKLIITLQGRGNIVSGQHGAPPPGGSGAPAPPAGED